MRSSTATLLLTAVLGLAACHKQAGAEADAPRSGLKVEAYDAPIAKVPNQGGKLGVMDSHPEAAASIAPAPVAAPAIPPPAASSEPPTDKPQARLATPARALPVLRVATPPAPKVAEPNFDLYDSPTYQTGRPPAAPAAAQPGFRITVPMCRKAEAAGDPLAKTAECASLLEQGREQQRLCKQAFETGNDAVALSAACRQAATFR